MKHENAQDIQLALSEILPIVAREAYFTAALFGMSSKLLDGREKKRNFEAAKKVGRPLLSVLSLLYFQDLWHCFRR